MGDEAENSSLLTPDSASVQSPTPEEAETASEADTTGSETRPPLALETALTWLARVKPAPVLALLRNPDFALISMTAFGGFRMNATGYANPLVRRRLAQEAVRDTKFADKLQALAGVPPLEDRDKNRGEDRHPPSSTSAGEDAPAGRTAGPPIRQADRGGESETRLAALKAERDRRRKERDEARQALADAEATRMEAERRRQQAETEREEALLQAQRQAQRIARLERQIAKLRFEQSSLLRALQQRDAASEAPPPPNPAKTLTAGGKAGEAVGANPWQAAVAHLVDKRRYDLALSLAEDVLRSDPDNPDALDIAAQGQGAKGDMREAAALLRRRLTVTLAQGARTEAGEVLLRLLMLMPSDPERDIRTYLGGLRADDTAAVEQARTVLARLRGMAPETHASVAASIMRLAAAPLAEALMPPAGRFGPDDPLPLGMAGNVSARQILRAVDTGHVDLVEEARVALARLGHTDPAALARVRQALEQAAGGDASPLVPLLGTKGRGPAVVDGSNAAWFDQEALATGRPRLRPLLGLRRALHARGYFPILLYADAPLPYTVDEPEALRAMVAQGELTVVDGGTDADEVLLREAKRFRAPLITNDYMTDWDPNNEVPKIRFTLSLNGEAYLLSE